MVRGGGKVNHIMNLAIPFFATIFVRKKKTKIILTGLMQRYCGNQNKNLIKQLIEVKLIEF